VILVLPARQRISFNSNMFIKKVEASLMKRENMYKLEVAEMTPREIDLIILSVNNMTFTKL
jgi:hypothetical protein